MSKGISFGNTAVFTPRINVKTDSAPTIAGTSICVEYIDTSKPLNSSFLMSRKPL